MSSANWDVNNSIIRLIDKTNPTPTTVYDILANKKQARLVMEEGDGLIPKCILYLTIDLAGTFIRTAPILMDKDTITNYLLEVKIAQNVGGIIKYSRLQRYRLSIPFQTEDEELGEVLQVNCEHIAYQALQDNVTGLNEELVTPYERINHLISYYQGSNVNGVSFGTTTVNIPNTDTLKRDYTPTSPQTIEDAFNEVIAVLREAPQIGGTLKNYYWYIEADASITNTFNIVFEEFGLNNSNVTINSTTNVQAALQERAATTENKKRKNVIIAKFSPRGGSLHREHQVFASKFLHARFRPEWVSNQAYVTGDLVKYTITSTTPYTIRFFRAMNAVQSTTNPDADTGNWYEDFVIIPPYNEDAYYEAGEIIYIIVGSTVHHYKANVAINPGGGGPLIDANWVSVFTNRSTSRHADFITYSVFTSNMRAWKQNLADYSSPPAGYVGYSVDWNYRRQLNDVLDYTNRFLIVTGKDVIRETNTPPTGRELHSGRRFLVGTAPTGAFSGHAKQIAEYVQTDFVGQTPSGWQFSANPVNNDTIFDWETGRIRRYSTFSNQWITAWDPSSSNDIPGPCHAVKDIRLVKGATGVPGQAIEFKYDWLDALDAGGNDINKTSRGVWAHVLYPHPFRDGPGGNIGAIYGGNGTDAPTNPFINHINLNKTSRGKIGWNHGGVSEEFGRLPEHPFKIRVGFFRSIDDSQLFYGKANIVMTYWRIDEDGRVFFYDFMVPQNWEWFPVRVPLPPFGTTNLYYNRLDELTQLYGYILPYQIGFQEKEYQGIQYKWTKNQSWGVFLKESYQEQGSYIGCYKNFLDRLGQELSQLIPTTILGFKALAAGQWADFWSIISTGFAVHHSKIALDEEYYTKEGYAIFPQSDEPDALTQLLHVEDEDDYLTALALAEAEYYRTQFNWQDRFINCSGNVDINYGKLITETGTRVPGGSLTSVIANNKMTIDNKGFNHELQLVKKFEL